MSILRLPMHCRCRTDSKRPSRPGPSKRRRCTTNDASCSRETYPRRNGTTLCCHSHRMNKTFFFNNFVRKFFFIFFGGEENIFFWRRRKYFFLGGEENILQRLSVFGGLCVAAHRGVAFSVASRARQPDGFLFLKRQQSKAFDAFWRGFGKGLFEAVHMVPMIDRPCCACRRAHPRRNAEDVLVNRFLTSATGRLGRPAMFDLEW